MDYETKKCAYCGDDADSIDHIVPVSFYYSGDRKNLHLTSEYGEENLVDCCRECNCLAGNKVFDDFYKKKEYIQDKLITRYKKVINMPFWSDEELKEIDYPLKTDIEIQTLARKWILNRINYPVDIYPNIKLNQEIKRFLDKF
jgi:hypothetical protein